MATSLQEVGQALIGTSLTFGFQATGDNNRVIRRRYKMRIEDYGFYRENLTNPKLYDAVYTKAVIVNQTIESIPDSQVDCYLVRTFAEVPTEWDDFEEMALSFPGVERPPLGDVGDMVWRSGPRAVPSVVRIRRKYFLGHPQRIYRLPVFTPTDALGNEASVLRGDTIPASDDYVAMVHSGQELVMRCRVYRWQGDIWCRETIYARAQ